MTAKNTTNNGTLGLMARVADLLKTTHESVDYFVENFKQNNDLKSIPAPIFGVIPHDGIKSTYTAFQIKPKTVANKIVIKGGGAEIKARIDEKNGVKWVVVAYNTAKNISKEFTLNSLTNQEFSNALESIHLVNLMTDIEFKYYKQSLHAKKNIDAIRAINFIGYDRESGCYVYPDFYIDPKGVFHTAEKAGYYDKIGVLLHNGDYSNNTATPDKSTSPKDLINNIFSLYGVRGVTPLMYFVASKFRHLFIDNHEFGYYPFLSFYGTAQNGKSALMKALNGLNFKDGEGIQANNNDTAKALPRQLSQYSGQATVIAELTKNAKFNVDSLLVAYNGGALYTRAEKDNSNSTSSVELNSGLVIAVNAELATTKQAKERFISVKYDLATRQALGEIKDAESLKTDKAFLKQCHDFSNACDAQSMAQVGRWILEKRGYFEANLLNRSILSYDEIVKQVESKNGLYDNRAVKHLALCLGAFNVVFELINDELNDNEKQALNTVYDALINDMGKLVMERVKTAKHDTPTLDLFIQAVIDYVQSGGHHATKEGGLYIEGDYLYFKLNTALNVVNGYSSDKKTIGDELKLAEYVTHRDKVVKLEGKTSRLVVIDIQKFTNR